jgi:endonuclease G
MLKYLLIGVSMLLPISAVAATAPTSCAEQFVGGNLPEVESARLEKARVLCFSEYGVMHSGVAKTPIWSAEHLTAERIEAAGKLPRKNPFHAEDRLPVSERAELDDYKGSGFDRGHMSPNGDMSTPAAQRESFSLANMIPQDPCSNEEQWEGIEAAVRDLVTEEDEAFVVTGPVYPADADRKQIGNGVLVPPFIFKAVYIPSRNAAAAYVAPNTPAKEFRIVSLEELKPLTGIDVFPTLPQKVKMAKADLPAPEAPKFHCRVHNAN